MTDLTEHDIYLFREGTHFRAYDRLGAHLATRGGEQGATFAVWAPNARQVSVIGEFNDWRPRCAPARRTSRPERHLAGFRARARRGARYKYHIVSRFNDFETEKADPFGIRTETPPQTASIVWDLDYAWNDVSWQERAAAPTRWPRRCRSTKCTRARGGASRKRATARSRYREIAHALARLRDARWASRTWSCCRSWSTRSTARGATRRRATSRRPRAIGTPQDFMYLVDHLHQQRHRRDSRLGAVALPHRRARARPTSTARICTSTPIRGRASIRNGTAASSTTAATRCAASSSAARCSGSTSTTSTACAWTPSPRCSTSTMRARQANGSPTSTAARENLEAIELPAARSTRRSTATTPIRQIIAEESTAWPMVSRPTYRRRARLRHEVEHGLDARHARRTSRRTRSTASTTTTSSPSASGTPSPRTSCCRCRTTRWCTARAR